MMIEFQQVIRREMITSAVISAIISAFFVFAIFGGVPLISLWGMSGDALDFLPQTFMLSLMSSLIPALLLRRKLVRKKLQTVAGRTRQLSRYVVLRSLLLALFVTPVGSLMGIAVLYLLSGDSIAFYMLLINKIMYGAIIAALVSRQSLRVTIFHAFNEGADRIKGTQFGPE